MARAFLPIKMKKRRAVLAVFDPYLIVTIFCRVAHFYHLERQRLSLTRIKRYSTFLSPRFRSSFLGSGFLSWSGMTRICRERSRERWSQIYFTHGDTHRECYSLSGAIEECIPALSSKKVCFIRFLFVGS